MIINIHIWQSFKTSLPVDGGVSLLVTAGVAYGVKKAYDKEKLFSKKNTQPIYFP